jgi:hypothetical protein
MATDFRSVGTFDDTAWFIFAYLQVANDGYGKGRYEQQAERRLIGANPATGPIGCRAGAQEWRERKPVAPVDKQTSAATRRGSTRSRRSAPSRPPCHAFAPFSRSTVPRWFRRPAASTNACSDVARSPVHHCARGAPSQLTVEMPDGPANHPYRCPRIISNQRWSKGGE